MHLRRLLFGILHLAAVCCLPSAVSTQVRPSGPWRTISTPHFRVHFLPELEPLAQRTAVNAEFAWALLERELEPPRGTIDIVVADNVDYSNGYATVWPTNRIVIYARPPVDVASLKNNADWNLTLVTHELTHIFHLDRTRGWWSYAQRIFGRAPAFFPNTYAPSWIVEGLAVHYESKDGVAGRLNGTEFAAHVSAMAIGGALPPLDALSLAAPRYPDAASTYIFGSYAMSHEGRLQMRSFVERSSERLIPWSHESTARESFGQSFSALWDKWRDSVMRAESEREVAMATGVQVLTSHQFIAQFPRWTSDSTLVYLAADGKNTTGLYSLTLDGRRDRIGRRGGTDAPSRLADGRWLQAELDYTDPWSVRSDITVGNGIARRRATRGARLSSPDVHMESGRILAVRTDAATTSIVSYNEGFAATPRLIAAGSLDHSWSEPRWSRNGTRIAAVRFDRGGASSVVVFDATTGNEIVGISPRAGFYSAVSSPVWERGDTTILFVSEHEGRAQVYRADIRTGAIGLVWGTRTALAHPDVSPDGRRIAAVELFADGYRVVERATPTQVALVFPEAGALPPAALPAAPAEPLTSIPFRARQQLGITWWMPIIEQVGTGEFRLGARSSVEDVLGRHGYTVAVAYEFVNAEESADFTYTYAGLSNPIIHLGAFNDWAHAPVFDNTGGFAGYLARRNTNFSATAVFQRPRVRVGSYFLVGADIDQAEYRTYPRLLLTALPPEFSSRYIESSVVVGAGISTMQRPQLSLVASDGIALDATHRARKDAGIAYETIQQTIVTANIAKSLPLPGFAQHVVALHGAYGATGHRGTAGFGVGGLSGSRVELVPGYTIGSSGRLFGVRGFPDGRQAGVRAVAASAEYHLPLALIGRGVGLWPLFFQKTSAIAFLDTGAAWCSFAVTDSFLCTDAATERTWMKSYGVELGLDAALQYDWAYRFRVGFARPYRGIHLADQRNTFYFSVGSQW